MTFLQAKKGTFSNPWYAIASKLFEVSGLYTAMWKAFPDSHVAFWRFFSMGMALIPVSCTMSRASFHSSYGQHVAPPGPTKGSSWTQDGDGYGSTWRASISPPDAWLGVTQTRWVWAWMGCPIRSDHVGQKAHAEQNQTGDRSQVEGGRNPRTSPVPWHPVPYAAFLDGQERRGMYGVSCPKPRHGEWSRLTLIVSKKIHTPGLFIKRWKEIFECQRVWHGKDTSKWTQHGRESSPK